MPEKVKKVKKDKQGERKKKVRRNWSNITTGKIPGAAKTLQADEMCIDMKQPVHTVTRCKHFRKAVKRSHGEDCNYNAEEI